MIVVVVIPLTVVETSLTTVLDELPPPPDPELPLADCEDEADEVADVDEVADADDIDDVEEVDEVDVAALDGVAVTAAVEEAIALIDMKTSPEEIAAQHRICALFHPSTREMRETGAASVKKALAWDRGGRLDLRTRLACLASGELGAVLSPDCVRQGDRLPGPGLVGAAGFEPTTCSTQNCRATRLRYTPNVR